MVHVKKFKEGPWRIPLYLVWGGSYAETALRMKARFGFVDTKDVGEGSFYLGRCMHLKNAGIIIIILGRWRSSPKTLSVLVHECFHAVEFVFDWRDIPHSNDTSEAWAYTLDNIFTTTLEMLNENP